MLVDRRFVESTLRDLVAINSINPAFTNSASSEAQVATRVASSLKGLGLTIEIREFAPGRKSVIGRSKGIGDGPSLMLNGHIDTVGIEGMPDALAPRLERGRLYGRGAYDMKGGVTACVAAIKALRDADIQLLGDLVMTAVADEETESRGMSDVLSVVRTDAAIVTEATELDICLAHKGFVWIEVIAEGRAAHGSRFEEGIDANMQMGRFLAELSGLERELRARTPHRLVGPPSLHAATIRGGVGPSTYSPRCRVEIERRTIPGETEKSILDEIQILADRVNAEWPGAPIRVRPLLTRGAFEVRHDARIVNAVRSAAAAVRGSAPSDIGHSYWMDAALISAAGIETVVIGPSGFGAHAATEYVEVESVVQLAEILAGAAIAYCGATNMTGNKSR